MEKDNELPNISITAEKGNVNVALNNSSANQLNNSPADYSQLIEELNKLLIETNPAISEHRQLRGDAKEILESVEKTGEIPEASKNWLQDGLKKLNLGENVKTGVGVMTILEKVIELM